MIGRYNTSLHLQGTMIGRYKTSLQLQGTIIGRYKPSLHLEGTMIGRYKIPYNRLGNPELNQSLNHRDAHYSSKIILLLFPFQPFKGRG